MKILFVAAEVTPLVKVGGLADVIGSLPHALAKLGHDVRIIIPKYGAIEANRYSMTTLKSDLSIPLMGRIETATLKLLTGEEKVPVPIYMVENDAYFGGEEIYGGNDLEHFLFFSRAVFGALLQMDWQPEIVHCHDWHTSLVIMWLEKADSPYATIFTIHNLAYQGPFDEAFLAKAQLKEFWDNYPAGAPKPPMNFMSQGILWADLVTTVSRTYAQEIVTPEYGGGLDQLLRYRQSDLIGIVNGIDYEKYNPRTDPCLGANYDSATIERRVGNKLALQKRANLPQDADTPLMGMVQRLDEQKGFDILVKAADDFLTETKAQLIILGRGRDIYQSLLKEIAARYPEQVAVFIAFDEPLAHLIYAGCDLFLMPSRFEPCGLGQLMAMRYGALPIVRHTGGLVDTVSELSPDLTVGSGFVFREYDPDALASAVRRAVVAFQKKEAWHQAVRRVMKLDFSWRASAIQYQTAYRQVLERKSLSSIH